MKSLQDILARINSEIVLEEDYEIKKILFYKEENKLELIFHEDIKNIEDILYREINKALPETTIILNSLIKKQGLSELFICELLESYKESCVACVQTKDINITNTAIEIIFSYEQAKEAFLKKSLDKRLIEDIKKNCDRDISVLIKVAQNKSDQAFIEENEKAEKVAAKDIHRKVSKITESKKEIKSSLSYGRKIKGDTQEIAGLNLDSHEVIVEGKIFSIEVKTIKSGKYLLIFDINDHSGATICKLFLKPEKYDEIKDLFKEGNTLKVLGTMQYDNFGKYNCLMLKSIEQSSSSERLDYSMHKRVELHLYTQMSASNGFISPSDLIDRLESWDHTAIGITDQGVVQSFPDIAYATKNKKIKPLYGMELKLLEDDLRIFTKNKEDNNFSDFVVFDIETTGLSKGLDRITEIGAVKVIDGKVSTVYNQLVNPEMEIPQKIIELTGITDAMVKNEPTIDHVLPEFLDFVGESVIVAHNADFDTGFIFENCKRLNIEWTCSYLDTLSLARALYPKLRNHKLNTLTKYLGVKLENHHRASDDAKATANIFIRILEDLEKDGFLLDEHINKIETEWPKSRHDNYNAICYAKDYKGLKNLYKMVSESSLHYFFKTGGVPKSILKKYREGLLLGSGNIEGELYQGILNDFPNDQLLEIAKNYDFLEIQPIDQNLSLLYNGIVKDKNGLILINKKICDIGEELNIPVVATGNVYYMEPEDFIYRNIIREGQRLWGRENKGYYYLRTTEEMLNAFNYLGDKKAFEVVVENTNAIANSIEELKPIPDGTYPPIIDGSDKQLKDITYSKAYNIYGNPLPDLIDKRIDRELTSIISNGYAVLYIIAQKLVQKSNEDGYLVGSRGSVGSSIVAYLADITEVNSLPPHYICPNCKHSEFILDGSYGSGIDLPEKNCPKCETLMNKDGFDIPFEVFLGFDGDKEPDIDLNFAGEYQSTAHAYTEEMFGEGKVFRAGTITTVAENTAYGYINKFFEERNQRLHPAEVRKYQRGIVGVKRSTGQHPGGVMVVPSDKDITDFCPVQHPADDPESDVITTHFTYQSISESILKLDLLGHDVPSIIKMLSDITGVDPLKIPMDDKDTMEVFRSIETLQANESFSEMDVGTLGIPEFGTGFVRGMLKDTRPTTFAELVRISGLSHGTNVWLNNAQDLIREGKAVLKETICTRDDIMLFLIQQGLDKKKAFKIMETVRKGRELDTDTLQYMQDHDLPDWYIESCKKIEYLFPKAHAVAYNLMSYRIAYFKVHHPEAFYSSYFTTKIADYPGNLVVRGIDAVQEEMNRIKNLGDEVTPKEKAVFNVLEVAEEMFARGIKVSPVSLDESGKLNFRVLQKGYIKPPFRALEGVSDTQSISIYNEAQEKEFISIQEFVKRTKVNKVALQSLKDHGVLEGLPETNQLSFL